MQAFSKLRRRDNPVAAHILFWDFLDTQDSPMAFLIYVDELCERRDLGVDNFISEDDGEGFIADQMLCTENGMAQPQGFRLADIAKIREVRNLADLVEHLGLTGPFEIFFKFDRAVEVIFDGTFTSARDDDDVFDA